MARADGPAGEEPDPDVDLDLEVELAELVDEARADDAARGRERGRWLRQSAEADAQLAGTLVDLCERGVAVAVRTRSGRTLHGALVAVGSDFATVRVTTGFDAHVRHRGIAVVRPRPDIRVDTATGDRRPGGRTGFAELVAGLAPHRPRVSLGLEGGGEPVTGELRAAGADVLTLRLDGGEAGLCYVALDAVVDLTVVEPG
jgi:hypothetical protein